MPTVSAVSQVYNGADRLADAIGYGSAQTLLPDEVIIGDGGANLSYADPLS